MQQIEIDFEVFKALTAMRRSEVHTYNEVLRDMLGLEKNTKRIVYEATKNMGLFRDRPSGFNGFVASGRFVPDGSTLRGRYKGKAFYASIKDGAWVSEDGAEFTSASSAASAITGTNVNGLTFWEVKRPSDNDWTKLVGLPKG